MKSALFGCVIALGLAAPAQGQTIVDDSGGDIAPALLQRMFADLAPELGDAAAAEFRRLFVADSLGGDTVVCGEVNARTAAGHAVGYHPFLYFAGARRGTIYDEVVYTQAPADWAVLDAHGCAARLNVPPPE